MIGLWFLRKKKKKNSGQTSMFVQCLTTRGQQCYGYEPQLGIGKLISMLQDVLSKCKKKKESTEHMPDEDKLA